MRSPGVSDSRRTLTVGHSLCVNCLWQFLLYSGSWSMGTKCYGELREHKLIWSVTVTMTQISENHKTQRSKDGLLAKFLKRWPKWDVHMSHCLVLFSILNDSTYKSELTHHLTLVIWTWLTVFVFLRLKFFYNLFMTKIVNKPINLYSFWLQSNRISNFEWLCFYDS